MICTSARSLGVRLEASLPTETTLEQPVPNRSNAPLKLFNWHCQHVMFTGSWAIDSRDGEIDSVQIDGVEVWAMASHCYQGNDGWENGPEDFPNP